MVKFANVVLNLDNRAPGIKINLMRICATALFTVCVLTGCNNNTEWLSISGSTMGTAYHITVKCPSGVVSQLEIDEKLEWLNEVMSTYVSTSTLSRFNQSVSTDWFAVEPELGFVMRSALDFSELSGGAFDVTVGPLGNLWGFGAEHAAKFGDQSGSKIPTKLAVMKARALVGYEQISVASDGTAIRKDTRSADGIYVDLSAIAKGYGVDYLAEHLSGKNCQNYLVDIGGEVRAKGSRPRGGNWRIGVEVPEAQSFGAINRIIEVSGMAVATSGDYRNYIEWDGKIYSHIIDPRTGYPVTHSLASVTVVHESAMMADGFATMLTVLGPVDGFLFAQKNELAALFVWRTESGFEQKNTEVFERYLMN